MAIKLTSIWASFFNSKPETGMGYTICTAVLKDGQRFEHVVIDSGYITSVNGNTEIPFIEADIADFIITHDKSGTNN